MACCGRPTTAESVAVHEEARQLRDLIGEAADLQNGLMVRNITDDWSSLFSLFLMLQLCSNARTPALVPPAVTKAQSVSSPIIQRKLDMLSLSPLSHKGVRRLKRWRARFNQPSAILCCDDVKAEAECGHWQLMRS